MRLVESGWFTVLCRMNRWGQRLDCCGFLGMCGQPVKCIRAHARGNGGKAKADCILANPPFNMSD